MAMAERKYKCAVCHDLPAYHDTCPNCSPRCPKCFRILNIGGTCNYCEQLIVGKIIPTIYLHFKNGDIVDCPTRSLTNQLALDFREEMSTGRNPVVRITGKMRKFK